MSQVCIVTDFNEDWFTDTFKGGKTNSITGDKGGGKTHFAVWIIPVLISLGIDVFTNILFKRCVSIDPETGRKKFVEDYPPHIQKVESLTELLKKICQQLIENPYQGFVFFWDELQNSLSAYDWNTELFKVIIKLISISRKFGLDDVKLKISGGFCLVVMSPSFYRGIPAGIREELDNAFLKDEEIYDAFMKQFPDGRIYDQKEIVFYKKGRRKILNDRVFGEIIEVGTCDICDEAGCGVGDFVFAQKGFAFLELGQFDNGKKMGMPEFHDFLQHTSKVLPEDMPKTVLEYLEGKLNDCIVCGKKTPNPKYCCRECKNKDYYDNKKKSLNES